MKKANFIFFITFCSILLIWCSCCTDKKVPERYRQNVLKLKNEMENLERIPLEKKSIMSDNNDGSYKGIVNCEKRAEYISKNRVVWEEILKNFSEDKESMKIKCWKDDILFCKALYPIGVRATLLTNQPVKSVALTPIFCF